MRPLLERCIRLVLIVSVFSPAGCAGTKLLNWRWHNVPRASEDNPAVRILCIWEPAEGTGLDGLPTRGFAGQIFFFTAGSPMPVKVDGDVRIYLFDNYGPSEKRSKPIHQFDFVGDAWTIHLNNGTLGPSYHVFIPYVRKHPYQASCGLRVRLKPKSGPPLFSDMVHVTLPGPTPEAESQQTDQGRPAQLTDRTRSQRAAALPRNPARTKNSLGATLARQTIPLTSLVKQAKAAKSHDAEPETNVQPETVDGRPRQADHSTSNPERQTPSAGNPHPLRFKLQPADANSQAATGQHPLADETFQSRSDQLRRAALRRHPLADRMRRNQHADEPAYRHPLAEDPR